MLIRKALLAAVSVAWIALSVSCARSEKVATDEGMGKLEPYECGSVQRLHTLGNIFLASQPSEEDFAHAKDQGIKTVVTYRKEGEIEWDEEAVVTNLGMEFVAIPWNGPEELTDEVFDETRELLKDESKQPLLLHCGSANRVGGVWIAYRVLDDGLTIDQAVEEAKTVGLKTPAYEEKAKDYIARMQKE